MRRLVRGRPKTRRTSREPVNGPARTKNREVVKIASAPLLTQIDIFETRPVNGNALRFDEIGARKLNGLTTKGTETRLFNQPQIRAVL